ncbi:MAG: PQQ-binding-like beta-propeller repeat protein [Lacipirellulaceae bacterium]
MKRLGALLLVVVVASVAGAEDWPQWRGPRGDNQAAEGATAPVEFSPEKGVAWKVALPGRGHSSPVLVGDRVYLTTADEQAQTQSLLVLDRATGALVKETVAHRGGFPAEIHPNNTHASPTVACDGERVFALFCNDEGAWVTAFSLEGEQLWQERATTFAPVMFQFGFGSSPRLVGGLVVVSSEFDGDDSGIVALDPATGERRWFAERPESLSYSTPSTVPVNGKTALLLTGNEKIAAYDPATGDELWSVAGTTRATCGTMVWDEKLGLAFGSGGYPGSFTCAVRTTGKPEIVWQKPAKSYEQSMIVTGGYLYATADGGIAYCWRASDGEEMWRERLGGKFSSSPTLVGDKLYAANERGTVTVFRASPDGFELLAENQLGDEVFATPAPVDGRLYYRYADSSSGKRQEYLAAFGE